MVCLAKGVADCLCGRAMTRENDVNRSVMGLKGVRAKVKKMRLGVGGRLFSWCHR